MSCLGINNTFRDVAIRAGAYTTDKGLIKYATTFFGKRVKKDVALGFTLHYFAEAKPCNASPEPAPTVLQRTGNPKVQIEIPPCMPTETPSPLPSATQLREAGARLP
ncbi:MAG: hypothetical protein ABI182_00835 [Candidatus Baltobacteraceae bacterium]